MLYGGEGWVQLALLVMFPAIAKEPPTFSVTAPVRVTLRRVALPEPPTRLPEIVRLERLADPAMMRPEASEEMVPPVMLLKILTVAFEPVAEMVPPVLSIAPPRTRVAPAVAPRVPVLVEGSGPFRERQEV